MQNSERLLANFAALDARRSIELLLERSMHVTNLRHSVFQAVAYFQSYDVLFGLLPIGVIPRPFPLTHRSPFHALLEGFMPIELEMDNSHRSLCCET